MVKIKNIKASIFVYILFLVTLWVTISAVLLSNISFLSNYSIYSKTELSFIDNIKSYWDNHIDTHKFFNSNWSWFIDTKSCPQNLTLSWTTQSWVVNTTLSYSGGLFSCNATYNWKDIKINLDSNYNFENVSFSGQNIRLNSNNSWWANTPSVAYSLRRLSDSYSGALIKVRRSSDNALLNIWYTSTWWLDTFSLLNFASGSISAFVDTWYDQSWNGLNATQTTTSNQPRIVNAWVLETITNNKPGINWFDTNWARMLQASAPFSSANEFSVNFVYKEVVRKMNVIWSLNNSSSRVFTHLPRIDWNIYFDVWWCCSVPQRLFFASPFSLWTSNIYTYYNSSINNKKIVYWNWNSIWNWPSATGSVISLMIGSVWSDAINWYISEFILFPNWVSDSTRKLFEQSQSKYFQIPVNGLIVPDNNYTFSFSDTDKTFLTFSMPTNVWDNYDDNFNSDNFKVNSTWSVNYPWIYQDDDVFVRKNIFWFIYPEDDYKKIFWNNTRTSKYIDRNINNNDNLNIKIWNSSSWVLFFDLKWDYKMKILEIDKSLFNSNSEVKVLNKYDYVGLTSSWYLQRNGSLNQIITWNELFFDFKNKDYALFLKSNTWTLNYSFYWQQSWTGLYINPIDDSYSNEIRYLWNDMIIENWIYKHKHKEIIYNK